MKNIYFFRINLFRYAYVECENNTSSKDKAISDMYQAFVERLSITLKTVTINLFVLFKFIFNIEK